MVLTRHSELARYVEAPVFVPRREPNNAYANENDQMVISSSSASPTNGLNYYLTFEPSSGRRTLPGKHRSYLTHPTIHIPSPPYRLSLALPV
jgi:hypothetical protein